MAAHAWLEGFLHHNPMTTSQKVQNLNSRRTQKLNPFIANDYFAKLKTTVEELRVMNKTRMHL
jgi:hypothetical protein